jgi:hypothetical protein
MWSQLSLSVVPSDRRKLLIALGANLQASGRRHRATAAGTGGNHLVRNLQGFDGRGRHNGLSAADRHNGH